MNADKYGGANCTIIEGLAHCVCHEGVGGHWKEHTKKYRKLLLKQLFQSPFPLPFKALSQDLRNLILLITLYITIFEKLRERTVNHPNKHLLTNKQLLV